ncbi:MAG: UvrD-helicase domain-containing protein [Chitinispirillaceae bacterium]|nr:UvrD-helicase domain-containing protein [Chitinispirillaceae bacterium]
MGRIRNITGSRDVDLLRHGVIEAHAGTGKTYTIVKLVMRILEEPDPEGKPVHLRQILLVTFTDKAAGELKKRIREGLEARIRELRRGGKESLIAHLENCLNNMHEAFIGTIHSVCLRLLRTWPFETGVQFRTDMVDDKEGLEKELRASMRTDWQDPGTGIPRALERLQEQGVRLEERHVNAVAAMAGELQDTENTELDRRACFGSIAEFEKAEDECRDCSERLKKTLRRLTGTARKILMEPAGLNDRRIAFVSGLVRDWESAGEQPVLSPELVLRAAWVKKNASYTFKPDLVGKEIALPTIVSKNPSIGAFAGDCRAFADDGDWKPLLELRNTRSKLLLTMLCEAAERLRGRWDRVKREKGLISFQDMLRLMHRAVSGNRIFRDSLRGRLRFGIIDEFQDTSILQWRIFEAIFLDGAGSGGPRLFIVGDPKQSIYAFQGADVQSYLDAKSAIEGQGGKAYGLVNNFRSLPEIIDGYNTVFGRENEGPDWFGFDGAAPGDQAIAYPDSARGGVLAGPPERKGKRPVALGEKPVQVMVLEGGAGARRSTMARWTSSVIRALIGRKIAVPKGDAWTERQLDYRDFAVIVESHSAAGPFLERFQKDGIPAVKYKMEGVFQSPMARDLHAVLRAVLHSEGGPAPRLAALLTRFFNRRPADIDPEKALEFCRDGGGCDGDRLCIAHALEEWTALAERRRWSRMFSSIEGRTGVRERLVRLADGERHLADLRQIAGYCIEKLCRGNFTLEQLVEHLGRLLNEKESAGQDRNLYTLATDRSSVRVLTMHAAKGLEFPVVFAVPGSSDKPKAGMVREAWISGDHKRHIMPADQGGSTAGLFEDETGKVTSWGKGIGGGIEIITEEKTLPSLQSTRERRRLLYVALTRAQAMLFVPAQVREKAADWLSCPLPAWPDNDLTPRLLHLLAGNRLPVFDAGFWETKAKDGCAVPDVDDHLDPAWTLPGEARHAADEIQRRIAGLDLPGAVCLQTSYTELSSRAAADRSIDRSGEEKPDVPAAQRQALPGGSETGDALHLALEQLLSADRETVRKTIADAGALKEILRGYLDRNGVLKNRGSDTAASAAVDAAAQYVKLALETPLDLPGGGTAVIADLDRKDRIPEMEFTLCVKPCWAKGYMDLVFRVSNSRAKHPWRYYVLDWKSDTLEHYTADAIQDHVRLHYEIQEKLYSRALDRFLQGLLGGAYEPRENLGGPVYVFLRGFGTAGCHSWSRIAEPENDARFIEKRLEWLRHPNAAAAQ